MQTFLSLYTFPALQHISLSFRSTGQIMDPKNPPHPSIPRVSGPWVSPSSLKKLSLGFPTSWRTLGLIGFFEHSPIEELIFTRPVRADEFRNFKVACTKGGFVSQLAKIVAHFKLRSLQLLVPGSDSTFEYLEVFRRSLESPHLLEMILSYGDTRHSDEPGLLTGFTFLLRPGRGPIVLSSIRKLELQNMTVSRLAFILSRLRMPMLETLSL